MKKYNKTNYYPSDGPNPPNMTGGNTGTLIPHNMKKENKIIYILDHKIKWKTFKELQDKLAKQIGPVPIHGEKALWHLLRKRKILCWFAIDMPNDMGIGLEIPKRYKNWKIHIITNRKLIENDLWKIKTTKPPYSASGLII